MSFTQEKQQTEIHRKSNAGRKNHTGIPLQMKQQYEKLSGLSFDDVRVHYNSGKPAQFQALAYTQGNQVFIGPGQETHLGHELGHVVQQKQGRVRATQQIGNIAINNDTILEREADHIGKAASKLDNIPTQFASRQVPIQRMAIRAQQPPKGQEGLFANLEAAAKITDGVGAKVINAGEIPSSKVTNEENIAFMGHGSPIKIGDLKPEDIVQNIENVLTVNEVDGRKVTDWNGKVFLMGCNTGRAYREDESREIEDEDMSLADKVEKIYNNHFEKKISDVVGTFLPIYAPSDPRAITTGTGEPIKDMLYIKENLNQNQELVKKVRRLNNFNSIYGIYRTLIDVYCKTKKASMFRPLEDSIMEKTPIEIRQSVVDFLPKVEKIIQECGIEVFDLALHISYEKWLDLYNYYNTLQLCHDAVSGIMQDNLGYINEDNEKKEEFMNLDEMKKLSSAWSKFNKLFGTKIHVDFTNDESTYHTAKAKALAAPE